MRDIQDLIEDLWATLSQPEAYALRDKVLEGQQDGVLDILSENGFDAEECNLMYTHLAKLINGQPIELVEIDRVDWKIKLIELGEEAVLIRHGSRLFQSSTIQHRGELCFFTAYNSIISLDDVCQLWKIIPKSK